MIETEEIEDDFRSTDLPLLRLLNLEGPNPYGRPTKASRNRVMSLISAINEVNSLVAALMEAEPERKFWEKLPKAATKEVSRIREMLSYYPKSQTVHLGGHLRLNGLYFTETFGPGRPEIEQLAVSEIIEIAKHNQLYLLRRCTCGRWFIARRHHQKSCSAICRHKAYEQTDDFKEKRRAYMRDYYRLKQSGKVK